MSTTYSSFDQYCISHKTTCISSVQWFLEWPKWWTSLQGPLVSNVQLDDNIQVWLLEKEGFKSAPETWKCWRRNNVFGQSIPDIPDPRFRNVEGPTTGCRQSEHRHPPGDWSWQSGVPADHADLLLGRVVQGTVALCRGRGEPCTSVRRSCIGCALALVANVDWLEPHCCCTCVFQHVYVLGQAVPRHACLSCYSTVVAFCFYYTTFSTASIRWSE